MTSHPLADSVAAIGSDAHVAVGTGLGTALFSFCFFASGALVPVLPRQLLIGYGAAAVTYGLGLLFGAGLA